MKDNSNSETKKSTIFWAIVFHILTVFLGFYFHPSWFFLPQFIILICCILFVSINKKENTDLLFFFILLFVLGIVCDIIVKISNFIDGEALNKSSKDKTIEFLQLKASSYAGKNKEKESNLIFSTIELLENESY